MLYRQGAGRTADSTDWVLVGRLVRLYFEHSAAFYTYSESFFHALRNHVHVLRINFERITRHAFAYPEAFFVYADKALVERMVLPTGSTGCWQNG